MAIGDINNDNTLEIVLGLARGDKVNAWLITPTGTVAAGWPRVSTDQDGYSWGVYSNNVALANLDGGTDLEIIVPSDVHYIWCV